MGMEDESKTKKQLIKELAELRDKLSQLESLTGGSAGAAYALFKDKEAHSALFDVIQHAICIINADSTSRTPRNFLNTLTISARVPPSFASWN
jgi:hypothetical protein